MNLRMGTVLFVTLSLCAGFASEAFGQGELIGRRGGATTPAPTTPVLPPTLNLPDNVESSLLRGLNSSGTALRPGMGWLVSDLTHQGIHGRELADIIHQLKPYKQRGVLTFPQPTDPGTTQPPPVTPPPVRGDDDDRDRQQFGRDKDDKNKDKGDKHEDKHQGQQFQRPAQGPPAFGRPQVMPGGFGKGHGKKGK